MSLKVLLLFVSARMAVSARKAAAANLKASDKRMSIMKQIIEGITAIKMCAWEDSFLKVITAATMRLKNRLRNRLKNRLKNNV